MKSLLELLNYAYGSTDPFLYIQEKIKEKEFGIYYLNQMIPKRIVEGDNIVMKEEIQNYRDKNHEDSDDVVLKYLYCYFGTSISHLFGNFHDNMCFYPEFKLPVIAYGNIIPNNPFPYLWFDINKNGDTVKLIQQNKICAEYVKVKVYYKEDVRSSVYINLKSKKSIISSKGSFIEIELPTGNLLKPFAKQECIILITIEGRFIDMYHGSSKCFVACHPI